VPLNSFNFKMSDLWDNAPALWYLIYACGLFLGILVVYFFWKEFSSDSTKNNSEDEED
jgi:hypothetical protein